MLETRRRADEADRVTLRVGAEATTRSPTTPGSRLRRPSNLTIRSRMPSTPTPADRAEAETLRQLYAPYYHAHCREKTAPYAGIPELLRRLRRAGLRLAVVSNKGDSEVRELADALFPGCFDCALGVRPERRRKPAPDMIRLALDSLGVAASDALYVGDSEVDLETAARSGLACVSVDWGFRDHDFLVRAGAARIVSDPEALAACLLA